MTFRKALKLAADATRENLLPGLLLQCLMVVFVVLYFNHDGTQRFLGQMADWKRESGFAFAFCSYVFAAALMPELLRIAFFQNLRVSQLNVWNFWTGGLIWGSFGIVVDLFYRLQNVLFGIDHPWHVVAAKILVDQLIFSPFLSTPVTVGALTWRNARFRLSALREIFSREFLFEKLLPIQCAGWCIWLPALGIVYSMSPDLQLPVCIIIQTFWVLIFTTINERKMRRRNRA